MNTIFKKIIRIFTMSSIVFYILFIIICGINLGIGLIRNGTTNLYFNLSLAWAPFLPILIVPICLIFGFLYALILTMFSLLDKRVLERWFVIGFILYLIFAAFIFKSAYIPNAWFSIGFILISLGIIVILMNIPKWFNLENKKIIIYLNNAIRQNSILNWLNGQKIEKMGNFKMAFANPDKKNKIIDRAKKTIKIFVIIFISFHLLYMLTIFSVFLGHPVNSPGYGYINFLITSWVTAPMTFSFIIPATVILYLFSILDKRFLETWFLVGFVLYSLVIYFMFNMSPWLYQLGFILIFLVMVLVVMNIEKWIKKSDSNITK